MFQVRRFNESEKLGCGQREDSQGMLYHRCSSITVHLPSPDPPFTSPSLLAAMRWIYSVSGVSSGCIWSISIRLQWGKELTGRCSFPCSQSHNLAQSCAWPLGMADFQLMCCNNMHTGFIFKNSQRLNNYSVLPSSGVGDMSWRASLTWDVWETREGQRCCELLFPINFVHSAEARLCPQVTCRGPIKSRISQIPCSYPLSSGRF